MSQSTMLLDTVQWDLVVDLNGNIAVATEPYSLAQDAASAIRTFQGEVYYNTDFGTPYWSVILAQNPPASLVKTYLEEAALTVPGVEQAQAFIQSITNRTVTGQVQIADNTGTVLGAASF